MRQENHPNSSEYLSCSHCVKSLPESIRSRWNCGLLSPHNRTGPGFPSPPAWGIDSEVCPGYLITIPQVIEAARARIHWQNGCLKERYEDQPLTGVLFDCIEILDSSVSRLESRIISKSKD